MGSFFNPPEADKGLIPRPLGRIKITAGYPVACSGVVHWVTPIFCFTDSGINGSKESVARNYQRFRHLFHSKHEKKPKKIKGLEGMYSLKRLSETV
jgi:hypothetical protein